MKPSRSSVGRRDDRFFEGELGAVTTRPVFIIGLHRSGTTFLYRMLTDALAVASLTVYHVVHYDRLLLHHHEGTTAGAQQELDRLFQSWQMTTRRLDDFPLSHAMPEEYGWILRRRAGSFHFTAKTAPVLDEICRKLHFLTPSAGAVLLKNPWDTGRAGDLLAHFPEARFIFLQRDPVEIVNSQFRVARQFAAQRNPFVELLFRGIPFGRAWLGLQRAVRSVAGERWHSRIALRVVLRSVARELARLEASWRIIPPDKRVALEYGELVHDTKRALDKVAGTLGLAPRREAVAAEPRPGRPALCPEVAAAERGFRGRLREKGIAQGKLEDIPGPGPDVK